MLLNCGVEEESWRSLGLQGDPTSYSKGDKSWVFIGRTDAKAETPILWLPDEKSWLIGKDPDAGKDWGKEEKGMTEDEMVGWHHWLDEHGFGWTLGVGDWQGGLVCCSPWGRKESDMTERLNWTEKCNKEIKVKVEHIWRLWGQISWRIMMWKGSGVTQRWHLQRCHSQWWTVMVAV